MDTLQNIFSSDDLYYILRKEILTLQLKPGSLLSENIVSKRFNISRTPIRGVFERLRKDDLLEVIPRRGTYVTLIDPDMAEQIIFMRTQIESAVMTHITKHPNYELFQKLEENLAQQKTQIEVGVISENFYKIDSKFHEICMLSAGKHKLWQMIQQMDAHYARYRYMDYIATRKFDVLYEEHSNLYDCMKNNRIDELHHRITSHLYGGFLRIGNRFTTEYKSFLVDGIRTIDEILLDVKLTINESKN